MNALGPLFVWGALQVAAFSLVASAIYWLARQGGPDAAAGAAAAALTMVLVLSLLAISPWPQWWHVPTPISATHNNPLNVAAQGSGGLKLPAKTEVGDTATIDDTAAADDDASSATTLPRDAAAAAVMPLPPPQSNWDRIGGALSARSPETAHHWPWATVAGVLLGACGLIGLLRMGLGVAAVVGYRRRSTPVHDPLLLGLLTALAREMRCRRKVQIRACAKLSSPATIGWLCPVIILPQSWGEWSELELRAVLAHELAHIRRDDYLLGIVAQLSLAVNLYQPLVIWLVSRLRLEQELAADGDAAALIGDRKAYLATLARLALKNDDRPLNWAVRPFVPGEGTLLRRIATLRTTRLSSAQSWGAGWRVVLFTGVAGIALAIAGLRGPEPASVVASTPDAADTKSENQPVAEAPAAIAVADAPIEMNPADGVLTGVLVKASDKTAVAGARVILRGGQNYYAESDAAGRFRLEKIPASSWKYELWAYQGNFVTEHVPVRELGGTDSAAPKFAPLRLEMTEGKKAKFIVTSEVTGKPISGAVVRFGYPDRRKTETDDEGMATVQGLLSQEYEVTIEAVGHARAAPQINLSHDGPISEFKVALVQGGVLQGLVVDDTGQAVPGAEIVYREPNGVGFFGDAYVTDAQGHFRNRFLPLNKPIQVTAHKKDSIDQEKDVVLTVGQREMNLRITLARRPQGGSVAGTVSDPSGRPVAGAKVANYGNRSEPNASTTTDAQGKFLLENVVAGYVGYEIAVSAKGFAPQLVSVQPGTAKDPGTVTLKLGPGHMIHGRTVDEQGKPMQQAYVSVRSGSYPMGLGNTTRTDEDGKFALDSLPADARFDVQSSSFAMLLHNIPLKLNSDEPVAVALPSPGTIRGTVFDRESDKPLPQFRVRLGFCRSTTTSDPKVTFSGTWSEPGVTFKSGDGRFAVEPLTDGMPVELTVEAEGYERTIIPRAVAAKADKAQDLKVTLQRIDRAESFTLKGRLVNHAGKPAAGAQLRLIVSANQSTGTDDNRFNWVLIKSGQLAQKPYCEQFLSLVTDGEGRFEFPNVRPGKYLQLVYWGDGIPQGRSLAFDETQPGKMETVSIKLPEPATVRGKFDRPKFPDAGSIRLSRAREAFQEYVIQLNDQQATFEFRDLPPGDYSLVVSAKPVRVSENGVTLFKIAPLAGEKLRLKGGETKDVHFTQADKQE